MAQIVLLWYIENFIVIENWEFFWYNLYSIMHRMYRKGECIMGLFDFFKKPNPVVPKQEPAKPSVPESDKKYYQNDSYYTDVAFSGTSVWEKGDILWGKKKDRNSFKDRTIPQAEILLLEYCSYGTYPVQRMVIRDFGGLNTESEMLVQP